MDYVFELLTTFVDPVAMIMALVLILSILRRKDRTSTMNTLILGGMFSLAVVFSMSDPINLGTGGIHDMRGLLIGASTALLGPVVGLMAMISGLLMRWHLGGHGMIPGFVAMFGAFGGGLIWRALIFPRAFAIWKKSVLMGLFISVHLVGLLFFPSDMIWGLFIKLSPYYVLANVVGCILFSFLIGGELSFLSEAESLKIEANTDHLTGLLNRRGLDLIVPELAIPNGGRKGRALLYFDIDNFKRANDTYGHSTGDDVLRRVADCISGNLRKNDVFARMGGDEFAIILPEVDVAEAQLIADRCRSVVADQVFDFQDGSIPITISLGAIWLNEPPALDVMLSAADEALYEAKSSGRNAVVFLSKLQDGLKTAAANELGLRPLTAAS